MNLEREERMTEFNDTVEAPVFQTTGGKAILSGDNGGHMQLLHPASGNPHIELIANETAPANTGGGVVNVMNGGGSTTIQLNGHAGDIILAGGDCAEDFDVSESEQVEPGTVMVMNREGLLEPCRQAYDKRVTGVVSGAGDLRPGIVLDKQQGRSSRVPIALLGKVYCKADAEYGAIEVGDLLVTSPTPDHAMRASDPIRAFGAVIGKALGGLESGRSLLPILVSLR
jgi:hypothetical protein